MSSNNNKGSTWAAKVHKLNEKATAHEWHKKVADMSIEEIDRLDRQLSLAGEVVKAHCSPVKWEEARANMARWAEEDNAPAAFAYAHGLVILANLFKPGCTRIHTDAGEANAGEKS